MPAVQPGGPDGLTGPNVAQSVVTGTGQEVDNVQHPMTTCAKVMRSKNRRARDSFVKIELQPGKRLLGVPGRPGVNVKF